MANPTGKGGFKKGQSGNPSGRKKDVGEVREVAKKYTNEAIETLAHWMKNGEAKVAVTAAQALLDRAWGRPAQALEHGGSQEGIPLQVVVKKFEYDGDSDDD